MMYSLVQNHTSKAFITMVIIYTEDLQIFVNLYEKNTPSQHN